MTGEAFDIGYHRALLYALTVAVLLSLIVAASTSGAAFGLYNPAWDGASELRTQADKAGADVTVARNVTAYDAAAPNGTVAIVLSPSEPYDTAAVERIRRFVARGGTLVVAEDFGPHANRLLAGIGARSRIDGAVLRDERYHHRSPAMPIARNVTREEVDALTLNHGTAVRPNGSRIVAMTSEYAYRDENRNEELDDNETMDAYPVVTAERIQQGRVVVVGDPSVLINAMLDREGNRAFTQALFADADRALLDYSHAAELPPLTVALLEFRGSPSLQFVLGLLAIGGIAIATHRPEWFRRVRAAIIRRKDPIEPGAPEEPLIEFLLDRHPDWDRERAWRIVKGVNISRDEGDDDG